MEPSPRRPRALESPAVAALLFVLTALLVTLPGLGATGLVKMEGMVADTALEMLRTGDLLVPRLYGEIFAFKPPLLYWLVAALFALTGGASEWALRLPAALSGPGMGLAVMLFVGRRVGYRTGALAGVASFTGILFLQKLRIAEFDALLSAFVGIAVAAACHGLSGGGGARRAWGSWAICYAALAAACLTKGAPALMVFAPGLAVAALVTGRRRVLAARAHLVPAGLFLLAALAYLGVAAAVDARLLAQPLAEARVRGAEWTVASLGQTVLKPLVIWAVLLPWSATLFWGWPRRGAGDEADRLLRAAWSFLLAGVVAFMLVPTFETRYYLPLAAPCGIASALTLRRMLAAERPPGRVLAIGLAAAVGLLTVAIGLLPEWQRLVWHERALIGCVGAGATVVAAAAARPRHRVWLTAALLGAVLFVWSTELLVFRPRRVRQRDFRQAGHELRADLEAGEVLWTLGPPGRAGKYSSILYYSGAPIRTFADVEGPPPGALCLLRSSDLGHLAPEQRSRLRPLRRLPTESWTFLLFRAEGA